MFFEAGWVVKGSPPSLGLMLTVWHLQSLLPVIPRENLTTRRDTNASTHAHK